MVLPSLMAVLEAECQLRPRDTAISVLTQEKQLLGYGPDSICAVLVMGANPDSIFQ